MKRDMDLVRDVLLALEDVPAHFGAPVKLTIGQAPLAFADRPNGDVAYHIRIMTQGDLISMGGISEDGITIERYHGFRWLGHEFLDDVRDPKAWSAAKDGAKKVGSGSLGFIWEVAKSLGKYELGKRLGIPLS
ncbi:DUF2513 domain-containing protein [Mesorhizobium sp. M0590]|uniref:DUF2513 domain-containing protein n=1 Tax=unclassified Mesorhizobium TaxID=325217 RepID=UPI00333CD5CF